MTRCRDEHLLAEVVAHQLVVPHGHLGKTCAIELVIDAVEVIGTKVLSVENQLPPKISSSHMLAHMPHQQLYIRKPVQHSIRHNAQNMHIQSVREPQR